MSSSTDDYPSALWITIPPILLLSAYYVRKWYLARKLRLYGIGKGAPGFQTNVHRIRVTPEIAARIRRGEDVSPEDIAKAAAQAKQDEVHGEVSMSSQSASLAGRGVVDEVQLNEQLVNEWLPESLSKTKKKPKGKRR